MRVILLVTALGVLAMWIMGVVAAVQGNPNGVAVVVSIPLALLLSGAVYWRLGREQQ